MEEITEEGVVVKCSGDSVEIALKDCSKFDNCSSRFFCGIDKKGNKSILSVKNTGRLIPGDEVAISISGITLLRFSIILYGVPLLIFSISVFLGMNFFNLPNKEIFSCLTGILFTSIYFLIIYLSPAFLKLLIHPTIKVSVINHPA